VTQVQVEAVAELQRRGTFAAYGYPKPDSAVATMPTMDRGRAREIVRAADKAAAPTKSGQQLPNKR
jgi:hypothetical protein